jgi:hypothetical protein
MVRKNAEMGVFLVEIQRQFFQDPFDAGYLVGTDYRSVILSPQNKVCPDI